jgi:hypothetical protein
MVGDFRATKRIYFLSYIEVTFGIRGGMITTPVEMESDDVEVILNALKVALVGPSKKDQVVIKIREELQ